MVHNARKASKVGLTITTEVDMQKVHQYIYENQEKIEDHCCAFAHHRGTCPFCDRITVEAFLVL